MTSRTPKYFLLKISPEMTLLVGLKSNHGLVVAADSRVSDVGNHYNQYRKLNVFSNGICVLTIGSGEATGLVLNIAKTSIEKVQTVEAATAELSKIALNVSQSFLKVDKPVEHFGFLTAGFSCNGGFEMYTIQSRDGYALQHQQFIAILGFVTWAGHVARALHTWDRSILEMKRLAAFCITESASQDLSVGLPLAMASFSGGHTSVLARQECESLVGFARSKSNAFRDGFFSDPALSQTT